MLGLMPGEHDWMKRMGGWWGNPLGLPNPGLPVPGNVFGDQPDGGGGLFGRGASPDERDAKLAFAAQLLSGSGYSPQKRSFGEILGQAMLAGQQARAVSAENAQKRRLVEAQIKNLDEPNRKPLAVMGPDGKPIYVEEQNAIGKAPVALGSTAEPPASLQEYALVAEQYRKAGKEPPSFETWLRTKAQMTPINPSVQVLGNVPSLVQPTRADPRNPIVTPLSNLEAEKAGAAAVKGAEAAGKAESERYSTHVDVGLDAADSISTVRRGIELLDSVKTGGIDAAKLKATNLFGVTGADEAELSANLGKAVLSQLRATFGAQFTEKEGQRLAEIEAGFGKSTDGNRRLLQQAEKILERAARRGIRAAERLGDADTAQEIRDAMEFTLSPGAPSGKRVTKSVGGKNYVQIDGQWYEDDGT